MSATAQFRVALADRYEIEREIGRGGMATVYLARDVRHERLVALKVLDPELGAVLGVERFLAEIRVTANLQHPNLLPLFDSGDADGLLFYVMPYVAGESLRARLERERQLPVDEAVGIAVAIASALDYAHRHGVIHRDLKPENILLHEGQPLVADFGIALAVSNAGGARLTGTGLSLGTPQYMSPEQAMGERVIDARTDTYSLGVVLYEMLAAAPPFTGGSAQAVVAQVITEPAPDVRRHRPTVPDHVAAALQVALEKLPADRFATTAGFADALDRSSLTSTRPGSRSRAAITTSTVRRARAWAAPTVVGAAAGVAAFALFTFIASRTGSRTAHGSVVSSSLTFAPTEMPSVDRGFAVSPDGTQLAYATPAAIDGARLWIRSLRDGSARPIPGTNGAQYPFWAPDGASIGFFAGGHLLTVPVTGGSPTILAPAPIPKGGSWSRDGTIIYNPAFGSVFRVAASGGTPARVLRPLAGVTAQRRPSFLPDQRHFLIWDDTEADQGAVWIGDLERGTAQRLRDAEYDPAYSAAWGLLLFSRQSGGAEKTEPLFVQPFDLRQNRLTGTPVMVSSLLNRGSNWGSFSFSDDVLVYANVDTAGLRQMGQRALWRRSDSTSSPIQVNDRVWSYRVSHDGRRIAFGGFDLLLFDVARHVSVRVPTKLTVAIHPVWSPGDSLIAYGDAGEVRVMALDGSSDERTLSVMGTGGQVAVQDWTPDGRTILFVRLPSDTVTTFQLWGYSLAEHRAAPVFRTSGSVFEARLSPDGHWIAYESDESGSHEIYLGAYPQRGASIRVSLAGGGSPRWRGDGRELYFIAGDGRIMASTIHPGNPPVVAPPSVLVNQPVAQEPFFGDYTRFDVMPDGNSFVLARQLFTPVVLQIVTGWSGLAAGGAR